MYHVSLGQIGAVYAWASYPGHIQLLLLLQDYLIVGRLIRLSSMPQVGPLKPQHIARLFAGR